MSDEKARAGRSEPLGAGRRGGEPYRASRPRGEVFRAGRPDWGLVAYAAPVVLLLLLRALLPNSLCDDAYISFRVAQNAAQGHGLVFNPGEPAYVSTSPLWVLLLAGLRFVVGDVPLAARILGVVFEALLAIVLVRYGRRSSFGPATGVLAAILLITNPVFLLTSFSGMELPLFLLVLVLVGHFLQTGRPAAAAASAACALWVRFDGIVVLAATLALVLWSRRRELRARPERALAALAPAAAVALAYVVFGLLAFGTWIPMSVQQKADTSPQMLSGPWWSGAQLLAREFGNAFLGRSAYWYTAPTPFVAMLAPLAIGLFLQISRRDPALVPLGALGASYALAYLGTGSSYATNFPWYFVPPLPAAYLCCDVAMARLWSWLSGKSAGFRRAAGRGIPPGALVVIWVVAAFIPLELNAVGLRRTFTNERERVYATAAVWSGRNLGPGAVVATNEIGALGFFLPPEDVVLDMYGLLRSEGTRQLPFVDLVRRQRPACIFSRTHFEHRRVIERALPSAYVWFRFRSLDVGIRADLQARLEPRMQELPQIYAAMRIDREYDWD